jgi:hypothetical protein
MRVLANVVVGRGVPSIIKLDAATLDDATLQASRLGYTVLSCRAAGLGFGE